MSAIPERGGFSSLAVATTLLFLLGAVAGSAYGAMLGFVGRAPGVDARDVVRSLEAAAVVAIPTLLAALVATVWISLTVALLVFEGGGLAIGVLTGWIVGLSMIAWAAVEGFRALCHAVGRWRECWLGAAVISLTFAGLLAAFLIARPELWLTNVPITGVSAVLVAFGLTAVVGLPVILMVRRITGHV
jgi:hypothetical protein